MAEPVVHASAPRNELPVEALRLRPDAAGAVSVVPAAAGWRYLSFRTGRLAGGTDEIGGGGREAAVVVFGGGGLELEVEGESAALRLPGRSTVFDDLPSAAWLPPGRRGRLRARPLQPGGAVTYAVAEAPASGRSGVGDRPILVTPDDVAVEIRGAGHSTRQINHIVAPAFPADRLLLVEVLTPAGNWSSWPPHKHDVDDMPNEAVLEEVYCYRFRRPEAWAVQRLYRRDGSAAGPARDGVWAVRDGEVVLVTDGYHPFSATDADDAYYLNALAGDRRTMACSFDPALDWVRGRWTSEAPDPRLPLVAGPASAATAPSSPRR